MDNKIISRIEMARLMAFRKLRIISEKDGERLDAWLAENSNNQGIYDQLMGEKDPGDEFFLSDKKAWQLFVRKYNIQDEQNISKSWNKYAIACSIALLVTIGAWWLQGEKQEAEIFKPIRTDVAQLILENGETVNLSGQVLVKRADNVTIQSDEGKINYSVDAGKKIEKEVTCHTIIVPKYGEYSVRLTDGSVVQLNSESSLTFPTRFSDTIREVWLKGEAYFKVDRDTAKRFVVHTRETDVVVLGTEFNVNAYTYQNLVKTTLLKGKVKVCCQGVSRVMYPGQQAVSNKGGREISIWEVEVQNEIAWLRGVFCFHELPLVDIMEQLSHWYDFSFVFENEALRDRRFSVELPKYAHVEEILKLIEEIKIVKFRKEGKMIIAY